jgi:hypothetical protein
MTIETEYECPKCGEDCWRKDVDVGVGVIYGPWGCSCGWSQDREYDSSEGPAPAPEGWRCTPQGVLVNLEREAEELAEMEATIAERFGLRRSS